MHTSERPNWNLATVIGANRSHSRRSSRKWTCPWESGCRLFESAGFHVSGQERGGMEHDQDRTIL